ncbi:hypothetical protein AMJ80_04190 [bacterium SM23_31]|nr:MAG: hypothetical protein AMJ80_04190 [bacterium SM23_31]
MTIIECKGVVKKFRTGWTGKFTAIDGVDLEVKRESIFGILGPNGAGKTTLVKIILGLVLPDEGSVKVFGTDVKDYKIRDRVGYLPENPNLPPYLTGRQVMELFGRLSGLSREAVKTRTEELLKEVKIEQWANKKTPTYSKGMIQRLGLAQALISDPDIIFLDEPTDGVDPIGRKEIRQILLELKNRGKTIFLNSHLLSETEMICDRVGIMDKGKIVAEGGMKELTTTSNKYSIKCKNLTPDIFEKLNETASIKSTLDGTFEAFVENLESLNRVLDVLRNNNLLIESVTPAKQSLESYFIDLIKDIREEDK